MRSYTRRHLLQMVGLLATACGTSSPASPPKAKSDSGTVEEEEDAGVEFDGGVEAGTEAGPPATGAQMLADIEAIVVVMMENRAFDHMLGTLKTDAAYASRASLDGLVGTETNPDPTNAPVQVFKQTNFKIPDLPHDWDPSHAQFDNGKNDGFVKAHAGANQNDAMGFHDRSQLPFLYWLADNFTVCDRWFCSVMGPTWPNRYYMHAGTSGGKKDNSPFLQNEPLTIWEKLRDAGKSFYNYHAGGVPWFPGGFPGKIVANFNPCVPLGRFFSDASQGTLPDFSLIDPDFGLNDDHPPHDVKLGQVFLHSVYNAIFNGRQADRTLLVITYDENGGLFDHVPPPSAVDEFGEFRQYGFRVPALLVGPMVKKGYVNSTLFDHTSVLATVCKKFAIQPFTDRMKNANDLTSCFDPKLYKNPTRPSTTPPVPTMQLREVLGSVRHGGQRELEQMVASGQIPARLVDRRSDAERVGEWLGHAERVGAVKLSR